MAVHFSTFNWKDFESKIQTAPARLAKLVAGRVGKSTLDPERLLAEAMKDPSAAHIEALIKKNPWYRRDPSDDDAAYDAITMNLLSDKIGKEFKLSPIDDAFIDFTTLAFATVTVQPGTRKLNPFTGEYDELVPRISLAEKCGLQLKSLPLVLGQRFRTEVANPNQDSQFGIHSPTDVSGMIDECKKLVAALKKSKERNAVSMAQELSDGFVTPISGVAGPHIGLYATAET